MSHANTGALQEHNSMMMPAEAVSGEEEDLD